MIMNAMNARTLSAYEPSRLSLKEDGSFVVCKNEAEGYERVVV